MMSKRKSKFKFPNRSEILFWKGSPEELRGVEIPELTPIVVTKEEEQIYNDNNFKNCINNHKLAHLANRIFLNGKEFRVVMTSDGETKYLPVHQKNLSEHEMIDLFNHKKTVADMLRDRKDHGMMFSAAEDRDVDAYNIARKQIELFLDEAPQFLIVAAAQLINKLDEV